MPNGLTKFRTFRTSAVPFPGVAVNANTIMLSRYVSLTNWSARYPAESAYCGDGVNNDCTSSMISTLPRPPTPRYLGPGGCARPVDPFFGFPSKLANSTNDLVSTLFVNGLMFSSFAHHSVNAWSFA